MREPPHKEKNPQLSAKKEPERPLPEDVPEEPGTWPTWLIPVSALILLWIARFWYSSGFGFYEDDHSRVVPAIDYGWTAVRNEVWRVLMRWGDQGRLFHHNFIYLFSWAGHRVGGVAGMYWLAYTVAALNTVLFYLLLRKLSSSIAFAASATVAYALFPADTTVAYLTTAFGGQTSLTFFLLATHCYLKSRQRQWWLFPAYLLIFCSLMTYETVVPLFLTVPLLGARWDRKLLRELVGNGLVLGAMIVTVFLIRRSMGENFVSGLDLERALTWPIRQMVLGPLTSFSMFGFRPFDVWLRYKIELAAFLLPAFTGLLLLLGSLPAHKAPVPGLLRETARLAVVGILLVMLAYPLTFTTSATETEGRSTRVHLAAVVGTAIVAGAAFAGLQYTWRSSRLAKRSLAAVFAGIFAGQLAYGVMVQKDYRLAWRLQQALWRDVVKLCPDLEDNTVVLVSREGLQEATHIYAWGWAFAHTLRDLYHFPGEFTNPPLSYSLKPQWREIVAGSGNLFDGIERAGWIMEAKQDAKVILLEAENGRLTRRTGTLVVGDYKFALKEQSTTEPPGFEKGILYRYMVEAPIDGPARYAQ